MTAEQNAEQHSAEQYSAEQHSADEPGDAVCWLHELCPACGAMPTPERPDRCWRCGHPVDEEELGPAER